MNYVLGSEVSEDYCTVLLFYAFMSLISVIDYHLMSLVVYQEGSW